MKKFISMSILILLILIVLTMFFGCSNSNSNFDEKIFKSKTARYLGAYNNSNYILIRKKNGNYEDKKGKFKYAIFQMEGYPEGYLMAIKQYSGERRITLLYASWSSTKSGEIPGLEIKRLRETLEKVNEDGIYLSLIKDQRWVEGIVKFYPTEN